MGLGLLTPKIPLLNFYLPHVGVESARSMSAPLLPVWMDVGFFFNSIAVRLPFNLISDGSEWWLFYILIVILLWLCEDVSPIYLCLHLDKKSLMFCFYFGEIFGELLVLI